MISAWWISNIKLISVDMHLRKPLPYSPDGGHRSPAAQVRNLISPPKSLSVPLCSNVREVDQAYFIPLCMDACILQAPTQPVGSIFPRWSQIPYQLSSGRAGPDNTLHNDPTDSAKACLA